MNKEEMHKIITDNTNPELQDKKMLHIRLDVDPVVCYGITRINAILEQAGKEGIDIPTELMGSAQGDWRDMLNKMANIMLGDMFRIVGLGSLESNGEVVVAALKDLTMVIENHMAIKKSVIKRMGGDTDDDGEGWKKP